MLTIAIPTTDVPLLDGDGCNVTINGKPTTLRREGGYLCYEGNRCKILDEQVVGDDVDFIAASHGAEDEPHVIVRPYFTNLLAAELDQQEGEAMQNSQSDNSTGAAKESRTMNSRRKDTRRPRFLGVAILARHDPNGPFSKDNCYFRIAVSEEEAREAFELHVGSDLRDRLLELERQGWIKLDDEKRRQVMELGDG